MYINFLMINNHLEKIAF